jgi:hypothetical protein
MKKIYFAFLAVAFLTAVCAAQGIDRTPLKIVDGDVLQTGNQWMALPEIRSADGALMNFNVLSMSRRGLLQVNGIDGGPAIAPYFQADGKDLAIKGLKWELIEYWIPRAAMNADGLEATITYCAPSTARGAFLRLTLTNHRAQPVDAVLGVHASFGNLMRVTYVPVELSGNRSVGQSAWVGPGATFSFANSDTEFAWSVIHPGSTGDMNMAPVTRVPTLVTTRKATLKPGESVEADFVLGAGVEEFSSSHMARALMELLDRDGAEGLIAQTAAWCKARTKTTGDATLDRLMNQNYLYTELYAWGRTIDTEELVGVTSRSPRYYVSAAYWDRDAMLWSFPALLDVDPAFAREALEYALTRQLRNTGIHSRFIDGVILEDGFQLDEGVAPIIALGSYYRKTGDIEFLRQHQKAIFFLQERLLSRYDASTGLYSSLQDPQDEFQRMPFITVDNALVWRALEDLAEIDGQISDADLYADMKRRAKELHKAILEKETAIPTGATETILASATNGQKQGTGLSPASILAGTDHDAEMGTAPGQTHVFSEMPPDGLMKLPSIGFLSEDDPLFIRTYNWLHSKNYRYSFSDQPYGLPGSYRLLFTAVWPIADHLQLKLGRAQALHILKDAHWDAGIITEGVHSEDDAIDPAGRAFATAAGYMAHSICQSFCSTKP